MVKHIVSQDRDTIFKFDPDAALLILPVVHNSVIWGINLMMGSKFLGTFDDETAAVQEVSNLFSRSDEIYPITGYECPYDEVFELEELDNV